MKWIYRLVTICIILGAFALPFFVDNQQGQPMLSLPSFSLPGLQDALEGSKGSSAPSALAPNSASSTKAYKWQDENGQWHYGDAPPAQHQGIEILNIRHDVNVVQAFKSPEVETEEGAETDAENRIAKAKDEMTPENEDILSFERAQNIMKDAKLASEAMNARNDQLRAITGSQ